MPFPYPSRSSTWLDSELCDLCSRHPPLTRETSSRVETEHEVRTLHSLASRTLDEVVYGRDCNKGVRSLIEMEGHHQIVGSNYPPRVGWIRSTVDEGSVLEG